MKTTQEFLMLKIQVTETVNYYFNDGEALIGGSYFECLQRFNESMRKLLGIDDQLGGIVKEEYNTVCTQKR